MGRNAQPVDILTATGRKHLTKAEKENRKKSEIKIGSGKVVCPRFVISDQVAYKKWRELIADFNKAKISGIDLVSSTDAGILARYCKTFSEYQQLLNAYQRVENIHYDCKELDGYIENAEDFNYKVKKQLRDLFSINAMLTIETAINKKMDMLIKMEDRLFLNPLSKVKNVPKKEPEKKNPLSEKGYGNV